jgi:penicillin-binding protein 1C
MMAIRLELSYSQSEILGMYAAHAPFGGNIVGLEAASWRYFNRSPQELSWGEAATLAVLPNAPALIHPGRNRDALKLKRDNLLRRLHDHGVMDSLTLAVSLPEPLPDEPLPLPQSAPHLLTRFYLESPGSIVKTTIDPWLQERVGDIMGNHHKFWADNHVHNAAVIVAGVETGNVLAYAGNILAEGPPEHGYDVDIIRAPRSSGSILKPVLYAGMNDDGELLPGTLVPDVPVHLDGFTPKNYSLSYDGAVPAEMALARSLNIPSVFMLQEYGVERFHALLRKVGFHTINRGADNYGLSLILGGAEVSLWDLAGVYASFSRTLNHFYRYSSQYNPLDFRPLNLEFDSGPGPPERLHKYGVVGAGAIWQAYEAMVKVNRPSALSNWESFSSMGKIAWKTGTSFGFRDAWAVGTTPGYVVAVWVGNADGEGRPGLTGISAAAPLMFDVFSLLPPGDWFEPPYDELTRIPVCTKSGHRIGRHCPDTTYRWVCNKGLKTPPCPYHQLVPLDAEGEYRVSSGCAGEDGIQTVPWFRLPPVQEWYYAEKNSSFRPLPPLREDCSTGDEKVMDFIFPIENARIFVPVEITGEKGETVFHVAHRVPQTTLYWHLDEEYVGKTSSIHQLGLTPEKGAHRITVVDEMGNSISSSFEVVSE